MSLHHQGVFTMVKAATKKKKKVRNYGPLTLGKLKDFIGRRNRSDFQTNLQFQIDADAAGIVLEDDLPKATREEWGYSWETPFGRLEERRGKLSLVSVKVTGTV
jgi:hypothetical protein